MRLGVIADDLTGALDTGVQFTRHGLDAYVALERCTLARTLHSGGPLPDVAVINSRTRSVREPQLAVQETLSSLAALESVDRLFIKIDSTLRGGWRSVVAAASTARGLRPVICPAFPAQGRTVREGAVYLADGSCAGSVRLTRDAVCQDWVVLDAETDADLDAVISTYWDEPDTLLCGSAGLAGAAARLLARAQGPGARSAVRWGPCRRIAVVIGSRTELSRAQVASLRNAELAGGAAVLLVAPEAAGGEDDPTLALALAQRVAEGHKRQPFDGFILSGGETADHVLTHLRAETVELALELLPGCPLGVLRGWIADGARVVTKSGSFGERDTLVRLVHMLHGGSA